MPRKNSKAAPKVTKGKARPVSKGGSSKSLNTRRARGGAMGSGYR